MSDIKSSPAAIARAMGWDFNSDTSPEALAAWEAYLKLPINSNIITPVEQDAFTAGFDAAIKGPIEIPVVPALPTVPGYYSGRCDIGTMIVVKLMRHPEGVWFEANESRVLRNSYIETLTDLTLLRPVAEVAAEVMEALDLHKNHHVDFDRERIYSGFDLREVDAKFGVVSE